MGALPRAIAALLLVLLLTECRWCGEKKPGVPPDWVAQVVALSGDVRIAEGPAGAAAAKQGDHLRVGSRLETGASSEATLNLRTGGSLKVKASSVVEFRSTMPQLQRGEVVGTGSRVQAAELVIGVGQRKVRLPTATEATVSTATGDVPTVQVAFGKATIEGPEGDKQTIVAGKRLVFGPPARPDAGPAKPDAGTVVAPEVVFYLQATGKGRVMIKRPDAKRFVLVRPGETVKITPGTRLKLAAKAKITVGPEKGSGTTVSGPAQFTVEEGPDKTADGKPTVRLENTGNEITVSLQGKPGKAGTPFEVDGVKVSTRITYQRLDVKVRKERTRSVLTVGAGEATLAAKNGEQRIEAGQDSIITKGKASVPQMPPPGVMEVRTGGTMRVFASGPSIPVTFKWNPGAKGSLVEVSRSPGFGNPVFSDVIQRRQLTLPQVARGSLHWRVTPVDASGKPAGKPLQGHLVLVKDTSHRTLKDRQAPKNVIQESFGNTTVYYQNLLPRFTFRWESMGADKYQVKIYREQNITKPIFTSETKSTDMQLAAGKLGEGTYVWYVAGRNADGSLLRASKFRRLQIKYDNATPDLQIVYPPNGAVVSGGSLEAKGVTIPGSKVMINGVRAELDETYRFTHVVKLKPGVNNVIFLVVDPRRGSSYYLRQVSSP